MASIHSSTRPCPGPAQLLLVILEPNTYCTGTSWWILWKWTTILKVPPFQTLPSATIENWGTTRVGCHARPYLTYMIHRSQQEWPWKKCIFRRFRSYYEAYSKIPRCDVSEGLKKAKIGSTGYMRTWRSAALEWMDSTLEMLVWILFPSICM